MTEDAANDVVAIREWISKEDYLPQNLDTLMIKKFLHSCYGSLEKTKKCIEKFSCGRSNMPELYTGRDPLSKKLQYAFSITCISTFQAGADEILIYHLELPHLDNNFVHNDLMKTFTIQADYWINFTELMADRHIIIVDLKYYTLRLITKLNIILFQKFLVFLLESMPIRMKQIHVINCPSYYEKLYALVKHVLPQEICDMINFHETHEALYSYIDKKYLPVEYGGDEPSMVEQQKYWVKKIEKKRDLFLQDNLWKADLTKKPKNNTEDAMNGSFRTLSID